MFRWSFAALLTLILFGGCAYSSADRQYEPSGNLRAPETERFWSNSMSSNQRSWGQYYDTSQRVLPDQY